MARLIVCLTGMPGAGKSTIAEGLALRGYAIVNMGDAVRAEARRRKLELTRANLGSLMLELRRTNGPTAIAQLVKSKIESSDSNTVLVDGVRSNDEIEYLRNICTLRIISVHASTEKRYGFLTKRGRPDDPKDKKHFDERDSGEIGVGISAPIALADEAISNNNITIPELVDKTASIIKRWEDTCAPPA